MDLTEAENKILNLVNTLKTPILDVLAIEWRRTVIKNFDAGGRPKWDTSSRYMRKKLSHGGKVLIISGNLRNYSYAVNPSESCVVMTSNPAARDYAEIQNEGGIIHIPAHTIRHRKVTSGKNAGRTVFASSKHKKFTETQTKAYDIVIPSRVQYNIPPEDFPRIVGAIKQLLNL
jgi:phage gpG-like protein